MENLLQIKNLNLFLGQHQALYNVNLNIYKGSIHALVGESGCGKTMTAMSIIKLLPKISEIKSGEILFQNNNLIEYKENVMREIRGNKIALIPQDPMTSLNPLYTIGNQLVESIQAHSKISKKEALKRAIEVLDLVKIPNPNEKLNLYPHELSGGMKQRVIIAMALATNAQLIIADEPTTALDVTIQKQIMDLLQDIKNSYNVAILLISHDLALVSNYADYISVMYAGKIVEQAETKKFFEVQLHPYTKALLNSLPSKNTKSSLKIIEGNPPHISENISGCTFHPRCEFCNPEICTKQIPKLEEKLPDHFSACLLK